MARFDLSSAPGPVVVGATELQYRDAAAAVNRFVRMGELPAIAALASRYPDSAVQALFSPEEMGRLRQQYRDIERLYNQSQALYFAGNLEGAWQIMRQAAQACVGVYSTLYRRAPELGRELRQGLGESAVSLVETVARGARTVASAATEGPSFVGKLIVGLGLGAIGFGLWKASKKG